MNELWVEKWRPKTIDGYVFVDDNQRTQVESWIKNKSIPHLLFSGGPGTGKTTLAKMLINELGIDEYDVMFANGSKEARKVEWVDKLISFCQTMPFGPCKVVLIDEADFMNPNSVQPALRNLMEDYSQSVRFILTCNYPNKIIPPLHSRCQTLHIPKTDHTEFTARVATILVTEGVEFDLDVLDTYVRATYPDLRKCLNLVQQNSQTRTLTAPVVESALPSSVSPMPMLIAAMFAITVPFIKVPAAMLTKPSTFQNTLQASAPLSNLTFELAPVENGPCI